MSKLKIILLGQLIVNLPVTFIIIGVILYLIDSLGFSFHVSLIISVAIGWVAWSQLLKVWISFCRKKRVSDEEIFKCGKMGLINIQRHRVFGKEEIKS